MWNRQQMQGLAEKILSFSQFPECSVSLESREEAQVRFANNGITTAGYHENQNITISSTREGRTGTIQVDSSDPAALKAAVARSEELAGLSPVNPEHQEPLGPQDYPSFEKWDEETAAARSPILVPKVKAAIDAALARRFVGAGFCHRIAYSQAVANKQGLFGFSRRADARLTTTVRAADGSSSGWAGTPSVHIGAIDGAELGARAAAKCAQWAKPVRLEPGAYTVLLEPTAVAELVKMPFESFLAREVDEGRSFFSAKEGESMLGRKLFPENITLRSDPADPRLPALPWTSSLTPNRPITWIEKGVLKNLAYSRYWAKRTGHEPTPMFADLVLGGGGASFSDLLAKVDRGLLVTRFWYIRPVNPKSMQVTGLTRDGLFLIEGGKVSKPVVNFRFNESPLRLLQNTIALGQSERAQGGEGRSMIAPPLVAEKFTFSSVSDAI